MVPGNCERLRSVRVGRPGTALQVSDMNLDERIKEEAFQGARDYSCDPEFMVVEVNSVRALINEALEMAQAKCSELAASYDQKCNSEARAGSHVMSRVFDHKSGAASRCVSLIEDLKVKPLQELP